MHLLLYGRKYLDLNWIHKLLNSKIDYPEILNSIPINIPKWHLLTHRIVIIETCRPIACNQIIKQNWLKIMVFQHHYVYIS